ncbi:hypothetical protein Mapa_010295 [Marchantia paleacea]|nr:hypothetical protein Mapa_010295 [Marchantia paleacea]
MATKECGRPDDSDIIWPLTSKYSRHASLLTSRNTSWQCDGSHDLVILGCTVSITVRFSRESRLEITSDFITANT